MGSRARRAKRKEILGWRGVFITFEGADGAGKSTQLRLLVRYLRRRGFSVCATREPGGTGIGEAVRRILLGSHNRELSPLAELALIYAARAQHLEEVIGPALSRGEVVVSDRFSDASMAYQGYGRKLGSEVVRAFDRLICGCTRPDLTLVLDLAAQAGLRRALHREKQRASRHSRFEAEGLKFQQRVRAGYLAIARREPRRVKLVPADRPVAAVAREIRHIVEKLLEEKQIKNLRTQE